MAERKYFGKLGDVIEPPPMIEAQTDSYAEFLQAVLQAIHGLGPFPGLLVFQADVAIDVVGQFRVDVAKEIQQRLIPLIAVLNGALSQSDELLQRLLVH